jgi:hypothetical protein
VYGCGGGNTVCSANFVKADLKRGVAGWRVDVDQNGWRCFRELSGNGPKRGMEPILDGSAAAPFSGKAGFASRAASQSEVA